MVAVNSEVDRSVVVVHLGAVRQTNHQTSVLTHAVCGNAANLVIHLRDGASAVRAFVPAIANGSALQVAQLIARGHALQIGPLHVLEVLRRSLTLSRQDGHHRLPTASRRSEREQQSQDSQKRPSSLQPFTRPKAFAAAPAFQQRRRLIPALRPRREEPHTHSIFPSFLRPSHRSSNLPRVVRDLNTQNSRLESLWVLPALSVRPSVRPFLPRTTTTTTTTT